MDASSWSLIVVALISVVSAALSGRAAKSASQYTSEASVMNSRTAAETEAYNRARKMDIETIERQEKDITKLKERVESLIKDNDRLHEANLLLRQRVTRLEQGEYSG